MKHYRLLLNGQNFLVSYEGELTYMGFYTTRFVVASSPEEAELKAIDNVRNGEKLRGIVLNTKENDQKRPMLFMDAIYEIEEKDIEKDYGFGWYRMDEEKVSR